MLEITYCENEDGTIDLDTVRVRTFGTVRHTITRDIDRVYVECEVTRTVRESSHTARPG